MKKITLVSIAIITAVSCSAPLIHLNLDRQQEMYFTDYSKYSNEGFMILPYPYQGNFDALGELTLEVNPAVLIQGDGWRRNPSNVSVSPYFRDTPYFKADTTLGYFSPKHVFLADENIIDDMVEMAVHEAKSRGANALVNFHLEYFTDGVGPDDREGYIVSGFLIRIK